MTINQDLEKMGELALLLRQLYFHHLSQSKDGPGRVTCTPAYHRALAERLKVFAL